MILKQLAKPIFHATLLIIVYKCTPQAAQGSRRVIGQPYAGHGPALFQGSHHQAAEGTFRPKLLREGGSPVHAEGHLQLLPEFQRQDVRHDTVFPEPDSLLISFPGIPRELNVI